MVVDILVPALIASAGINMTIFLVAYRLQSNKLTDMSYATTLTFIAAYGYLNSNQTAYHALTLVLIGLWSVRLGGFLLYRLSKAGKDSRFA